MNDSIFCLTHTDGDGYCSGAIVKYKYPQAKIFLVNYGRNFNTSNIPDNSVVFVTDFMLPVNEMISLSQRCELHWIDHHKTAMQLALEAGFNPKGLRDSTKAACVLTWMYLFPDTPIPRAVLYLGAYDVWDFKSYVETEPFCSGANLYDLRPFDNMTKLWSDLFENKEIVNRFISDGEMVLKYNRMRNKIYSDDCAFETMFCGKLVLAANLSGVNSKVFDGKVNPEKHFAMITFSFTSSNGMWRYSIYSTKPENDVSQIAAKYNGGGHAGAAGWHTPDLLFSRDKLTVDIDPIPKNYKLLSDLVRASIAGYQCHVTSAEIGLFSSMFVTMFNNRFVLCCNANCFDVNVAFKLLEHYRRMYVPSSDFGQKIDDILFFYMDKNLAWRYIIYNVESDLEYQAKLIADGFVQYSTNCLVSNKFNPKLPFVLKKFRRLPTTI